MLLLLELGYQTIILIDDLACVFVTDFFSLKNIINLLLQFFDDFSFAFHFGCMHLFKPSFCLFRPFCLLLESLFVLLFLALYLLPELFVDFNLFIFGKLLVLLLFLHLLEKLHLLSHFFIKCFVPFLLFGLDQLLLIVFVDLLQLQELLLV